MTLLIGGFSAEQYKSYLNPSKKAKEKWTSNYWISNFSLARFPVIAILINRLAFFLLHRMEYPNNVYLFKKFKSHDFKGLSQEQRKAAKQIFEIFKCCSELKNQDLSEVESRLNGFAKDSSKEDDVRDLEEEASLNDKTSNQEGNAEETAAETKDNESGKGSHQQSVALKAEVKSAGSGDVQSGKTASQSANQEESKSSGDLLTEILMSSGVGSPKDSGSPRGVKPLALHRRRRRRREEEAKRAAERKTDEAKEEEIKSASSKKKDDDKVDEHSNKPGAGAQGDSQAENQGDGIHAILSGTPRLPQPAKGQQKMPSSMTESTFLRTKHLIDRIVSKQSNIAGDEECDEHPEEDVSVALVLLPDAIAKIVSTPLGLSKSQTLDDLYGDGNSIFCNNVKILLAFAKQLDERNQKTEVPFYRYMEEIDRVFQNALVLAKSDVARLHGDFKAKFRNGLPPEVLTNNEVKCDKEHLQWIIETLSTEYPALYHLAFDIPSANIYQNNQLAALARLILLGPDASNGNMVTACFIQLRETSEQRTAPRVTSDNRNVLTIAGSYILTQFVGPHQDLEENSADVKKKLQEMAAVYVQAWLCGRGSSLNFGKKAFDNDDQASDWTAYVRNTYTATLMNMTEEELRKEVVNPAFNCTFIQLIIKAYQDEIDSNEWKDSQFPATLLEKILSEELRKSINQPHRQKIRQLLENSSFADPATVNILAKKACCAPNLIEPLLRIRLFYILCCLGEKDAGPIIRGLKERTETMCDPAIASGTNEAQLQCRPGKERVFAFDERLFDRTQVSVESTFFAPKSSHPIAQGETILEVSSLNLVQNENVKVTTTTVDLQDLRFSVYATDSYRSHLTTQVNADSLIKNMALLHRKLDGLDILARMKAYHEAVEANKATNSQRYWWQAAIPLEVNEFKQEGKDVASLKQALIIARKLSLFLNACNKRVREKQFSREQRLVFEKHRDEMLGHLDGILKFIGTLYSSDGVMLEDVRAIRQAMEAKGSSLDFEDDSPEAGNQAAILDPDVGADLEYEHWEKTEHEIGKKSGNESETLSTKAMQFAKLLVDSSELEHFRWKVERYEALIRAAQKCVRDYLKDNALEEAHKLYEHSQRVGAEAWLCQLAPIFDFCRMTFREDKKTWDNDYLDSVRLCYNETFLNTLRKAACWAKDHPNMYGVRHVNGICYQLYATMDLNDACKDVFNTFITLAQKIKKKGENAKQGDAGQGDKYALTRDLHRDHSYIKSVPSGAKASPVTNWAKSLIGHLNGILGWTFDPNMQSNPMHVLFTKVITGNGGGTSREVRDIAMGSPTIECGNGIATINPEFQGFLRHCNSAGLVHLYINNQDPRPKSMVQGDESSRCKVLHDLAERHFKGTLHVITLNQNSPFYQQQGHDFARRSVTTKGLLVEEITEAHVVKERVILQIMDRTCHVMGNYLPAHLISDPLMRKNLHQWMSDKIDEIHNGIPFNNTNDFLTVVERDKFVDAFHQELRTHVDLLLAASPGKWGYSIYDRSPDRFKRELISQMFDKPIEESGNFIPPDLENKFGLRKWSESMATDIHLFLFGGRSELTVAERKIFIRLFYRNLARKILIETKANSYNESCKDRIDRGAASDAEEYAYLAILNNCAQKPHVIAFFKMLVFARAIIVRKRSIIEERLERLIETVDFMLDNQVRLRQLQRKLFPNHGITIDQFEQGAEEFAI